MLRRAIQSGRIRLHSSRPAAYHSPRRIPPNLSASLAACSRAIELIRPVRSNEHRKHGADALALFGGTVRGTLAGAAIPGSVFRAAALAFRRAPAGECPRMVEFHNAILHPRSQNLVPRHSGTRISILPLFIWNLVRTLPVHPRAACLCDASTIIGSGCGKLHAKVAPWFDRCHLTVMQSGFELQSIVIVRGFT